MKQSLIAIFTLFTVYCFAQDSQKKYTYVIVPLQYEFTSEPNQFQLNVLTRMLLQQEGFEVYMSEGEEMPNTIIENQCIPLRAYVVREKGVFTTKLKFQLINCFGKVVFESEGTSRKKAFKDAYQQALRIALEEFQSVSFKYVQRINEESVDNDEIIEQPENSKQNNLSFEERASIYTWNDKPYWLVKDNGDYVLYLDKGKTIHASLKQAGQGTFSYDSENIDGAAYFTPDGDLIVEYLAKNEDAVQKIVYKRQKN